MNASSETWQLGSQAVQVSHLDKFYWPQVEFTKGDMLHQVVLERIQRRGDLFAPVLHTHQHIQ